MLAGLYWLYLFPRPRPASASRLALLVAAAPVIWALMDLVVTGDALHSLHGTSDLAEATGRRRDVGDAPYWTVQYYALHAAPAARRRHPDRPRRSRCATASASAAPPALLLGRGRRR